MKPDFPSNASAWPWFAVQCKPGQEQVAEWTLSTLDLETFLPRQRRERRLRSTWCDEVRPLFPGYLFARFCPALHLHAVRYSRGVCRVVGAGEEPWPVEDDIVAEIRSRESEDGFVRLAEPTWQSGQPVSLQEGPLQGWTGVFDRELDDRRRVVILLDAIQQARAVVEKRCLQPA